MANTVFAPRLRSLSLWDFDINQRHELLPSMQIPIAKVTLKNHAGNAELEGSRVVALKEADGLRSASIEVRKYGGIEHARSFHSQITLFIGKHNVKRQHEGTCVLAANKARELL
jgi:hypothetical protein